MIRQIRKLAAGAATVFLTGATGFLGGAFLAQLLGSESDFEGELVCLVRAEDQYSAENRLRKSAARFGVLESQLNRVKVIRGDVVSDCWHRAPELSRLTHVVHLAANTSFGGQAGAYRTNVDGALSVATAMQRRNLVRYIHTGTATICGAHPPRVVSEDDYPSPMAEHLVAYTESKAEAERQLAARHGDLPVIVARPSIVVGHTGLGCGPSGSIFWVLRAVEALRFIAWDAHNRVDVVPVDWVASSLSHLLFAPELHYSRYHISAGDRSAVRWEDIAEGCARIYGGPARGRYERGNVRQLTRQRVREAIGECQPRYVMHAMELYARFCSLDLVFDNQRLLSEGMAPAPRFTSYMGACLESSPQSIYDQMRADFETVATPVGIPA